MGYQMEHTLAGTRVRANLRDLGSAISVVNDEFLRDTGATDAQSLLVYTTNTEVGGIGGNFAGAGSGSWLDGSEQRLRPHGNTRVRGLAEADNTRDFFLTDIPWDSYNTSRIDIQRGPNATLFGYGSPAGIINGDIDGATLGANVHEIEGRFGSYGSYRGSFNINRSFLDDSFAIRLAALYDREYFQQDPAYERDERYFGAARWDPEILQSDTTRTSFRVSYEHGDIDANRPRIMPPIDAITPWFNELGKATYNPAVVNITDEDLVAAYPNSDVGALDSASANYEPWIQSPGEWYGNLAAVFPDHTSGEMDYYLAGQTWPYRGVGPDGAIDNNIAGLRTSTMTGILPFNEYATKAELPYSNLGAWKARSLTDTSIFDFRNQLLDGPNKHEWADFEALNITVEQTFFRDKLGFELVYDEQRYDEARRDMLGKYGQALTVDINSHLPNGQPNPNVGRPMVVSWSQNNVEQTSHRDSWRATAFGEWDFTDTNEDWGQWLGRHVLTGVYHHTKNDTVDRGWIRYAPDDTLSPYLSAEDVADIAGSNRAISTLSYLGPSIMGRESAAGADIPNIRAAQQPRNGGAIFFDSTWAGNGVAPGDPWNQAGQITLDPRFGGTDQMFQSENAANYIGWTQPDERQVTIWNADLGNKNQLYHGGSKGRTEIDSQVLVYQGYFLDNLLVATLSYREDELEVWNANYPENPNGSVDLQAPFPIGEQESQTFENDTTSYSLVLHSPQWINERLPWGTNLSVFYNESENFQPANRVDVMGEPLSPPTGETKDYGFTISTWENRISLKVNWYETEIANDTLQGFGSSWFLANEWVWGINYGRQAQNFEGAFANGYQPAPGQTAEEAEAVRQAAIEAFFDPANIPPDSFFEAYGIDLARFESGGVTGGLPGNFAVTGDTESEGIEFELFMQPTDQWNLTINAAKTEATRLNMAGSMADYIESRWELYQGPAGDLRMWTGDYAPRETMRSRFERHLWAPYNLYRLQEGSDVPELRPWRFNIVTNYTFDEGPLEGFWVGGAYRWQDGVIIGYPIEEPDDGSPAFYDISNPYESDPEDAVDFWIGYSTQIADGVDWRIQLNVRNALADDDLIPVTAQPDGSPAAFRIPAATTWEITNTFSF